MTRPNILIIMTDQHSRRVAGCYGNGLVRTPNLDRLAAEGMVLENAYCPAPLCVPSRMSFMTSRTPSRNRVWKNNHILSSNTPTWAHYLGIAGYRTALIGRMHFEGPDLAHGFLERPVGEFSAKHPGTPERGGPRFRAVPRGTSGQSRISVEAAGTGSTSYRWFDSHVTDHAVEFLHRAARNGSAAGESAATDAKGAEPFAAVVGYVLPHCPFVADKDLFDYYYGRVDVPPREEELPPAIRRWQEHRGVFEPPLPEERIRVARAAYFALVEEMDANIGRVLAALEESGQGDNTLVIYTSDHGEMAGEHGCWWKSSYYEGSAGVPLIARLPGLIEAGSRSQAVCNLLDIGPTVVELAGGAGSDGGEADDGGSTPGAPAGMRDVDGRSLTHVLRGDDSGWENTTYSELVDSRGGFHSASRMVRSGDWKLSLFHDGDALPPILHNVAEDADEMVNRVDDPTAAPVLQRLTSLLYDGWNPEWAAAESERLQHDYETLSSWGRTVRPDYFPETLAVPPEGTIETDVELR